MNSGGTSLDGYSYTVTNPGGVLEYRYQVEASEPWLLVNSGESGAVQAGESEEISIGFDQTLLSALDEGVHSAQLSIVDTTGQSGNMTREIRITVDHGAPHQGTRVTDGLVALYDFEQDGTTIPDESGVGQPLDLEILTPASVLWQPGSMNLVEESRIESSGPASKVYEACAASNELTLEAWITPSSANQSGPARIVSISEDSYNRNVTLGHGLWGGLPDTCYNVRLRTDHPSTDDNGSPDVRTEAGEAQAAVQHVVYTRDSSGVATIYVDGTPKVTSAVPGGFSNWDPDSKLLLGNEMGASRPWFGSFHLVAIYSRALDPAEVLQNTQAGTGDFDAGYLAVDPSSDFATFGAQGEVLASTSREHTITNPGSAPIQWSLTSTAPWARFPGLTSGTLAPEEALVTELRLDEQLLVGYPIGEYTAEVRWTNLTNGFGSQSYEVRVSIHDPDGGGQGAKPGPLNTGPSAPELLVPSGSITATQDGQIIENVDVSGMIKIQANNVTIRNFRVDGNGASYGITPGLGEYSGTVIEDGEILDVNSAGIYGMNFTARRLNIHESGGDGMKARGNVLVEDCWIHHLGMNDGSHADGNQTRVGSNLVFRHNNFDMPIPESDNGQQGYRSNATHIFQSSLGPVDSVRLEDNWLNGGNYTLMLYGMTNVTVLNNRFGRDYRYGLITSSGTSAVISGNVWDDTGDLIEQNNQ